MAGQERPKLRQALFQRLCKVPRRHRDVGGGGEREGSADRTQRDGLEPLNSGGPSADVDGAQLRLGGGSADEAECEWVEILTQI